ncbi:MAG: Dabb family protein [Myxococcota bacterium]
MIQRLVLLKLTDRSRRDAIAAEIRRVLPTIPGVRRVEVGRPADADAEVWDLMFAVWFDRLADVAVYRDHPDHVAFVAATLTPNVEVRKAWNFTVE